MIWIRYALLLCVIPAYFLALSRKRWSTIPLWVVSTSVMLTQFAMSLEQRHVFDAGLQPGTFVFVTEMTKIMLIPIAVQTVVIWHEMRIRAGVQPGESLRKLTAAFDASDR